MKKLINNPAEIKKYRERRRYYLHAKVRNQGYRLNAKQRTIYVPFPTEKTSLYVDMLFNEFGYGIQFFIPDEVVINK